MAQIQTRTIRLRDRTALIVRTARASDAPWLMQLDRHMRRTSPFMVRAEDELERTTEEYAEVLRRHIENPDQAALVGEPESGPPVARLMFRCGRFARTRHDGEFGLAVHADWRGRGVGRSLITALLDWGAAHPALEKVHLSVFAGNEDAQRLYRGLGFVEEGRSKRHFRLGPGQYEDDVTMSIWVKPGTAPEGFNAWSPRGGSEPTERS